MVKTQDPVDIVLNIIKIAIIIIIGAIILKALFSVF